MGCCRFDQDFKYRAMNPTASDGVERAGVPLLSSKDMFAARSLEQSESG